MKKIQIKPTVSSTPINLHDDSPPPPTSMALSTTKIVSPKNRGIPTSGKGLVDLVEADGKIIREKINSLRKLVRLKGKVNNVSNSSQFEVCSNL